MMHRRDRSYDSRLADSPAIRLEGLRKSYGDVRAVTGLDVTIRRGEIVALLGANGAGKSTTISMVLGLSRPDAGTVTLFGISPVKAVRTGLVGVMLQGGELPAQATVTELIELGRALYPRPMSSADVIEKAGLSSVSGRRLEELSGGEAQRVKFGFALAGDPDLLVLDEPTAGMDPTARRRFWETVGRRSANERTVVFATHYLAEADEFAGRIIVMSRGRVVADGSSAEIKQGAGHRVVRFDLSGGPTAGLDRLPGVRDVEVRDDHAVLTSDDADSTVAALIRARGPVRGLEVTGAGITDAFLALTDGDEEP